jgi:site-specific DNA recombinase
MAIDKPAGLNRRLAGRGTPRPVTTIDRPRQRWIAIAVPAIVSAETFERVAHRLAESKRFAARSSKAPSGLLQGLAARASCGYAYHRTSTRTTNKKIYYYRCPGSDNYRYEGGSLCAHKPVRADCLDAVVWDHLMALPADPRRDRPAPCRRPHRRPGPGSTREPADRAGQGFYRDRPEDRGVLRTVDHHR